MKFLPIMLLFPLVACASPPRTTAETANDSLTERPSDSEPVEATRPRPLCKAVTGGWPTFQGGAARRGSSDVAPIERPTVRWSRKVGIASWLNNPVAVGDRVYVGTSGLIWNEPDGADAVVALDLTTGDTVWFHPTEGDVNGVAYAECIVIATTEAGRVLGIDARTGERVWVYEQAETKFYTNPLVLGELAYVATEHGLLAALDVQTGEPRWTRSFRGAIRGGVASDGKRIFVATEEAKVAALRPLDGSEEWSTELTAPYAKGAYGAPTFVERENAVVVGFIRDTAYADPALVAFDAEDGAVRWVGANPEELGGGWGNVRSSPAVVGDELVYGEPYSNRVIAVDVATGEAKASIAAGGCTFPHWPSPAAAGTLVYVPRHDGGLYALDLESRTVAWSLYLGDAALPPLPFPAELGAMTDCSWEPPVGTPIYASPAIAPDGSVIVATGDGFVHAVAEATE